MTRKYGGFLHDALPSTRTHFNADTTTTTNTTNTTTNANANATNMQTLSFQPAIDLDEYYPQAGGKEGYPQFTSGFVRNRFGDTK